MLRSYRYEEIASDIRQQIQNGTYPTGKRLPAERDLMQQYGVQRNTIRQALILLQDEGIVIARARSGVYVEAISGVVLPSDTAAVASDELTGVILVINAWNRSSNAVDRLLSGLSESLADTALRVQRFDSSPRPGEWFHVLPGAEFLATNRVIGAVLWAQSATDLAELTRLRAAIPLVLVDRRVLGFEADCVRFDDVSGGRIVTEHLVAQGHRSIGFLGEEAFAETVQQRWRGYTVALQQAGISPDSSRVALFQGIKEPLFSDYIRPFLNGAGSPLTAVVCSNDSTALLLLRFLRTNSLRVPEDIAVTGYGNLLPDYLDTLELTTIAQPFEETGRAAGKLLRERLLSVNLSATSHSFLQVELPVQLIVRNSSTLNRPGSSQNRP